MNFLDFLEFIFDLILLKNGKKGVVFSQEPRADVVWCGTRADGTWQSHVSPHERLRGIDMVPHGKRVLGLADDGSTG